MWRQMIPRSKDITTTKESEGYKLGKALQGPGESQKELPLKIVQKYGRGSALQIYRFIGRDSVIALLKIPACDGVCDTAGRDTRPPINPTRFIEAGKIEHQISRLFLRVHNESTPKGNRSGGATRQSDAREKAHCAEYQLDSQPLLPCELAREKALTSGDPYIPQCSEEGQYRNIQCDRSGAICWCVDTDGTEIPGSRVSGSPAVCLSFCRLKKQQILLGGYLNSSSTSFIPRCKDSGGYEPVQCDQPLGECWCVDSEGMEIYGTRQMGAPQQCPERCTIRDRRILHGVGEKSPPQCSKDGGFHPVQCKLVNTTDQMVFDVVTSFSRFPDTFRSFKSLRESFPEVSGYCYCADALGRELKGTGLEMLLDEIYDTLFSGLPPSRSFPETAIYRMLQRRFLGVQLITSGRFRCPSACEVQHFTSAEMGNVHIPSCEDDGSYKSVQCQEGGQCWCVDYKGQEKSGTRVMGETPKCDNFDDCPTRRRRALSTLFYGPVGHFSQQSLFFTQEEESGAKISSKFCPSYLVETFLNSGLLAGVGQAAKDSRIQLRTFLGDAILGLFSSKTQVEFALHFASNPIAFQQTLFGGKFLKNLGSFNFTSAVGTNSKFSFTDFFQQIGLTGSYSGGNFKELAKLFSPDEDSYLTKDSSNSSKPDFNLNQPILASFGRKVNLRENRNHLQFLQSILEQKEFSTFLRDVVSIPLNVAKDISEAVKILVESEACEQKPDGVFVPTCTNDGRYKEVQCSGSECWCVDEQGQEIQGTRTTGQQPTCSSKCLQERKAQIAFQRSQPAGSDVYIPACDKKGNYLSVQCDGRHCFCVDLEGKNIPGTQKLSGENIQCPSSCQLAGSDAFLQATRSLLSVPTPLLDPLQVYVPQCSSEGEWRAIQCSGPTEQAFELYERWTKQTGIVSFSDTLKVILKYRESLSQRFSDFVKTLYDNGHQNVFPAFSQYSLFSDVPQESLEGNVTMLLSDNILLNPYIIWRLMSGSLTYYPGSYSDFYTPPGHKDSRSCWCINMDGDKLEGTEKPPNMIPKCPGSCEIAKLKTLQFLKDARSIIDGSNSSTFPLAYAFLAANGLRLLEKDLLFSPDQKSGIVLSEKFLSRDLYGLKLAAFSTLQFFQEIANISRETTQLSYKPYRPQCDRLGNWDPIQFYQGTGHYWCVDAEGGYIPGSLVTRTLGPPQCRTSCQQAQTNSLISSWMPKKSSIMKTDTSNVFIPRCTETGQYVTLQKSETESWCVHPISGKVVLKDFGGSENVTCPDLCTISKSEGSFLGDQVIASCEGNGSRAREQCDPNRNQCVCVFIHGEEAAGTEVTMDGKPGSICQAPLCPLPFGAQDIKHGSVFCQEVLESGEKSQKCLVMCHKGYSNVFPRTVFTCDGKTQRWTSQPPHIQACQRLGSFQTLQTLAWFQLVLPPSKMCIDDYAGTLEAFQAFILDDLKSRGLCNIQVSTHTFEGSEKCWYCPSVRVESSSAGEEHVILCDDWAANVTCLSSSRLGVNITWTAHLRQIPEASLPTIHDIGRYMDRDCLKMFTGGFSENLFFSQQSTVEHRGFNDQVIWTSYGRFYKVANSTIESRRQEAPGYGRLVMAVVKRLGRVWTAKGGLDIRKKILYRKHSPSSWTLAEDDNYALLLVRIGNLGHLLLCLASHSPTGNKPTQGNNREEATTSPIVSPPPRLCWSWDLCAFSWSSGSMDKGIEAWSGSPTVSNGCQMCSNVVPGWDLGIVGKPRSCKGDQVIDVPCWDQHKSNKWGPIVDRFHHFRSIYLELFFYANFTHKYKPVPVERGLTSRVESAVAAENLVGRLLSLVRTGNYSLNLDSKLFVADPSDIFPDDAVSRVALGCDKGLQKVLNSRTEKIGDEGGCGSTMMLCLSTGICPAGSYSKDGECTPCLEGSYQEKAGTSKCLRCPVGTTTLYSGAYRHSHCVTRCQRNKQDLRCDGRGEFFPSQKDAETNKYFCVDNFGEKLMWTETDVELTNDQCLLLQKFEPVPEGDLLVSNEESRADKSRQVKEKQGQLLACIVDCSADDDCDYIAVSTNGTGVICQLYSGQGSNITCTTDRQIPGALGNAASSSVNRLRCQHKITLITAGSVAVYRKRGQEFGDRSGFSRTDFANTMSGAYSAVLFPSSGGAGLTDRYFMCRQMCAQDSCCGGFILSQVILNQGTTICALLRSPDTLLCSVNDWSKTSRLGGDGICRGVKSNQEQKKFSFFLGGQEFSGSYSLLSQSFGMADYSSNLSEETKKEIQDLFFGFQRVFLREGVEKTPVSNPGCPQVEAASNVTRAAASAMEHFLPVNSEDVVINKDTTVASLEYQISKERYSSDRALSWCLTRCLEEESWCRLADLRDRMEKYFSCLIFPDTWNCNNLSAAAADHCDIALNEKPRSLYHRRETLGDKVKHFYSLLPYRMLSGVSVRNRITVTGTSVSNGFFQCELHCDADPCCKGFGYIQQTGKQGAERICLLVSSLGIQSCAEQDGDSWRVSNCSLPNTGMEALPFGWYRKPGDQKTNISALCPSPNISPNAVPGGSVDHWTTLDASSVILDPSLSKYDSVEIALDSAISLPYAQSYCLSACDRAASCFTTTINVQQSAVKCTFYPETQTCDYSLGGPRCQLLVRERVTSIYRKRAPARPVSSLTVPQGDIVGKPGSVFVGSHMKNVNQFLGVPYAAPPTGENRFRPPQPYSWTGTWNATVSRPSCLQPGDGKAQYLSVSEDCLYLNLFIPQNSRMSAPILLYFLNNPKSYSVNGQTFVDGSYLAAIGDIIVVTASYRVGVFGFLSPGNTLPNGNWGLFDQSTALKWVQENIIYFGGDPKQISIIADRAGADLASIHLLVPGTKPFKRAALMGGSAFSPMLPVSERRARRQVQSLAEEVGCPPIESEETLTCLRKVDANTLNAAQTKLLAVQGPFQTWGPVVDGIYLQDTLSDLLQQKTTQNIDLLIGSSEHDGLVSRSMAIKRFEEAEGRGESKMAFYQALQNSLGGEELNPQVQGAAVWYYSLQHSSNDYAVFSRALENSTRDHFISCPVVQMARHWSENVKGGVYMYYVPETFSQGSSSLDLPDDITFAFGIPFHPNYRSRFSIGDQKLSFQVMQYLANFVKTGNPNFSYNFTRRRNVALPSWPEHRAHSGGDTYKEFTELLPNHQGLKKAECSFWNQLIPALKSSASLQDGTRRTSTDIGSPSAVTAGSRQEDKGSYA
ncbi:thyroglobulin [Phyllobates terribilis]|uniref:thyroglobulin n=1 Tax=Phyllobates terribilis TaxID=111132 RepID=UPI003CCAF3DC